jgi:hypothetical protein
MDDGTNQMRRSKLILLSIAYALKLVSVFVFLLLVLEVCARIIHRNSRPIVPYLIEEQSPTLPPGADFSVTLPGHRAARYVTNDFGARVAVEGPRRPSCDGDGVLVVGDSQALGWGIDFENTFASRLAERAVGDRARARILASPATDPEHNLNVLERYESACPRGEKLTVFVLNLGNDLDELYTGRRWPLPQSSRGVGFWLTMHSFFYVDTSLLMRRLGGSKDDPTPGVNGILVRLRPDEQEFLADRAAELMAELVRRAPPSEHVVVLIIPQDYQVDAGQFDKYQNYYDSEQEFLAWKSRVPEFAEAMNGLERRVVERLEAGGVKVVRFAPVARGAGPAAELFDTYSHHLTPKAYRLVADAILASLAGQM